MRKQAQATPPPEPQPERAVRLAVTCGDPAGVGPEVALKALARPRPSEIEPVLVGPALVWEAARLLVPDAPELDRLDRIEIAAGEPDWAWGRPTPRGGEVAAAAVEEAARLALAGEVEGLVTAPLTKEGLRAAGRPFPGHTELLEDLCPGGCRATMMLAGARLKVLLVTTHLALADVPQAVTRDRVLETVRAARRGLEEDLGVACPRIAVLALNPHAGEGGVLGREEEREIAPAVAAARAEGIDAVGPFPADSLFHRAVAGEFDAVVAMYHDQGLGPLKLLHFHDGVNVTLGLPVIRTSPDHGTAFDIAGRGIARAESFREALRWAVAMARRRRERTGRGSALSLKVEL